MPVQVELDEQETALVIQAISTARLSAEFTAQEQLILKWVAEKLADQGEGDDDHGAQESD